MLLMVFGSSKKVQLSYPIYRDAASQNMKSIRLAKRAGLHGSQHASWWLFCGHPSVRDI
jgi:hypothetical protein